MNWEIITLNPINEQIKPKPWSIGNEAPKTKIRKGSEERRPGRITFPEELHSIL